MAATSSNLVLLMSLTASISLMSDAQEPTRRCCPGNPSDKADAPARA